MKVDLRAKHFVNGVQYGPGELMLEKELGLLLMEQDRRVVEEEARLNSKHGYIILSGRRVREIPYESFDSTWAGEYSPIHSRV